MGRKAGVDFVNLKVNIVPLPGPQKTRGNHAQAMHASRSVFR